MKVTLIGCDIVLEIIHLTWNGVVSFWGFLCTIALRATKGLAFQPQPELIAVYPHYLEAVVAKVTDHFTPHERTLAVFDSDLLGHLRVSRQLRLSNRLYVRSIPIDVYYPQLL